MKSVTKIQFDPDSHISENEILAQFPEVLISLLQDHSTGNNIFWATDNYQMLGAGYAFSDPIQLELISGKNAQVIMPRVKKDKALQCARVRKMAEVFTPSWVCNAQNNMIDSAWFERDTVFNAEITTPDGQHSWQVTEEKIAFPKGKTWQDYVLSNCLEMACGEAPYLASRYDTTTGEAIPLNRRIGILDRKIRIVNENVETPEQWLAAATDAVCSTYAFEWQGDSLLLARENILFTFIEYYLLKFQCMPTKKTILDIAEIVSWNIWQMDGLKSVVPKSCHETSQQDLFGNVEHFPCPGCKKNDMDKHNGIYCLIKDWKADEIVRFADLLHPDQKE